MPPGDKRPKDMSLSVGKWGRNSWLYATSKAAGGKGKGSAKNTGISPTTAQGTKTGTTKSTSAVNDKKAASKKNPAHTRLPAWDGRTTGSASAKVHTYMNYKRVQVHKSRTGSPSSTRTGRKLLGEDLSYEGKCLRQLESKGVITLH